MVHPVLGVDRKADQTSLVVCRQVVRLVVDRSVCRSDGWSVGLSVIRARSYTSMLHALVHCRDGKNSFNFLSLCYWQAL